MKSEPNHIEVARIKKAHGTKGELKIIWEEPYNDLWHTFDYLMVNVGGQLVPFFIDRIRGDGLIIKLENVDRLEDTVPIVNKPAFVPLDYIPDELLIPESVSENPDDALIGYTIKDAQNQTIGVIQQIVEMPQQSLAEIEYRKRQVLIPLHETFIRDKSEEHKTLVMDLPEGLLEL